MGSFQDEHKFNLMRELTVECLLGADFMEKIDVLIDCRRKCLQLGSNAVEVLFIDSSASSGKCRGNYCKESPITVTQTVKLKVSLETSI